MENADGSIRLLIFDGGTSSSDVSFQRPEEHLLKNQEFDREGYLFLIERSTNDLPRSPLFVLFFV